MHMFVEYPSQVACGLEHMFVELVRFLGIDTDTSSPGYEPGIAQADAINVVRSTPLTVPLRGILRTRFAEAVSCKLTSKTRILLRKLRFIWLSYIRSLISL